MCKLQGNQFSTARIMSDIFAMANAIYLRYDIHFTLFVCDMPSAFYSVIADLKSIFHRKRSPSYNIEATDYSKNRIICYTVRDVVDWFGPPTERRFK